MVDCEDPDYNICYIDLGVAYFLDNKPQKAVECLTRVIEKEPQRHFTHCTLGLALIHTNKMKEGVECFHKVISQKQQPWAYFCLGLHSYKIRSFYQAIKCFELAIEIQPNFVQAYCKLGLAYLMQNDIESARQCFANAFDLGPNQYFPNYCWGILLNHTQDRVNARKYFSRAILIHPNLSLALCEMAVSSSQNSLQTISLLTKAIQVNPNNIVTHCYLSMYLISVHNTIAAVYHFYEAVKISPKALFYNSNLRKLLHAQKQKLRMAEFYQRAFELLQAEEQYSAYIMLKFGKSNEAEEKNIREQNLFIVSSAYKILGDALFEINQTEEAIQCYDLAMETNPFKEYFFVQKLYEQSKMLLSTYCSQKDPVII